MAEGYPTDVEWALTQLADLEFSKSPVPVIAARTLSVVFGSGWRGW